LEEPFKGLPFFPIRLRYAFARVAITLLENFATGSPH
jgi:hypothetical protein